jgi:hypothetical protein
MHAHAQLTPEQQQQLATWFDGVVAAAGGSTSGASERHEGEMHGH